MSRFRLATVERLRDTRVQEAATELARAGEAVAGARRRQHQLIDELHRPGGEAGSPQQLLAGAWFRERLRGNLAALQGEIETLEAAREAAREAWLQARADLRAVETLHERHRVATRAEHARREQRELDDLAQRGRGTRADTAGGAA